VITTDTERLDVGEVQIPTQHGQIPAYRAMPAGKNHLPTVLVVQEIFGVHEYIKDVARRLAKQGYLAIAPELYARQGDATRYTDSGALMKEIVSKVSDTQVMGDLDGGADGGIPNDTVEEFGAALKAAGNTRSEMVIFPNTPHAFHANYRPSYRKEAAADGWKRSTAWFKQYLS